MIDSLYDNIKTAHVLNYAQYKHLLTGIVYTKVLGKQFITFLQKLNKSSELQLGLLQVTYIVMLLELEISI